MSSSFYSVGFLYVIFLFFGHSDSSTPLKFLLKTSGNVIRCSQDEYLVIDDWFKLKSSNISCPNQATLFEKPSIPIYDYNRFSAYCNDTSEMFYVMFYAWNLELVKGKLRNWDKKELKRLSSTVDIDNHEYPCTAVKDSEDASVAIVNKFQLNWSYNNTFVFYVIFNQQPTICRIYFPLTNKVNNKQCTNETGLRSVVCYNDPISKSPMTNVDWKFVLSLIEYPTHYAPNTRNQGGYYVDLRAVKTTTTTSTTTTEKPTTSTTTTTTEKVTKSITTTTDKEITASTTITTTTIEKTTTITEKVTESTTTTTATTITTTTDKEITASTTITTITVEETTASTTTTTTEKTITSTTDTTTTTITTTTDKEITASTTITTTTVEETTASTTTTTTTTEKTITSTTTTTTTTTTSDAAKEITTSTTAALSTTSEIETSTTTTTIPSTTTSATRISTTTTTKKHYIPVTSTKKASTKMRPSQNNSAISIKHSAKKSSSPRSIFLVILFIFFILGIIGTVLIFIYRSQRKRQDDDESPVNRVNSDESDQSDMNEYEANRSIDSEMSAPIESEIPPVNQVRKGGRTVSQLDPDAM